MFLAKLDSLERYAEAGMDRVVVLLPERPNTATRELLVETARASERMAVCATS